MNDKVYVIRCRESGDEITYFDTMVEAEKTLDYYAHCDMLESLENGDKLIDIEPFKDFYEIVECKLVNNEYVYD